LDRISPYSSPDMGWGEGWGAPLELALAWDLFAPEQEEPVASAVEKQLYIWLALPRSTAKPSRSHPRRELEEDKETARKEREQS